MLTESNDGWQCMHHRLILIYFQICLNQIGWSIRGTVLTIERLKTMNSADYIAYFLSSELNKTSYVWSLSNNRLSVPIDLGIQHAKFSRRSVLETQTVQSNSQWHCWYFRFSLLLPLSLYGLLSCSLDPLRSLRKGQLALMRPRCMIVYTYSLWHHDMVGNVGNCRDICDTEWSGLPIDLFTFGGNVTTSLYCLHLLIPRATTHAAT
jgi:hypothetical protein